MLSPLLDDEVIGLVHPAVDAHTLGVDSVAGLLREAGYASVLGGRAIGVAVNDLRNPENARMLAQWCRVHRITRLGLSCRLDPAMAEELVRQVRYVLRRHDLYGPHRGQIRGLYFAGLPEACEMVRRVFDAEVPVFSGDEIPTMTLSRLGVPAQRIPAHVVRRSAYDEDRLEFGRQLVATGRHLAVRPAPRDGYPEFGTATDTVARRLADSQARGLPPLIRTHYGPFLPDRAEALRQFYAGVRALAAGGHVDVLSIGTSQLTQERFGLPWGDTPNGGGVPINSADEYRRAAEAAHPMLVRTYAGSARADELARIHEESLNIAWHALSFWWFSRIDGRGPNGVRQNLQEHVRALEYIATTGKPFEPNIAHHFAFRGGDDLTCVVAAALATRTAARCGVRTVVLQTMLNTPKMLSGIADLAKARATLALVRALSPQVRVILQPRAGLDYLVVDPLEARAQIAAVTALMDDIEPDNPRSPGIVHVVGYSEATSLATPEVIAESAQITQAALASYRQMRGLLTQEQQQEVDARTQHLVADARRIVAAIDKGVADACSPEGLHAVLRAGFLAAPHLWEEREEFSPAVRWRTALVDGAVEVVDQSGQPLEVADRIAAAGYELERLR
jgi:hypothetical protein